MTISSSLKAINFGLHAGGLGVTVAIVYVTCTFAVVPMQDRHLTMASSILEEKRWMAQSSEIHSHHREIELKLSHSEESFARVISRIPETPHESEFLAQVTELARNSKLRIQRYHPREPVNEGTHTALEVQLDLIADYPGICRFLDGLRTLARLCRVTSLHVRSMGSEGAELAIEMTLRIYFAPLSKTTVAETLNG